MSARDVVLARVRAALADVPAEETAAPASGPGLSGEPAGLSADGAPGPVPSCCSAADEDAAVARFATRAAEYRAHVVRTDADPAAIAAAVAGACARHNVGELVVPGDLDAAWIPTGVHAQRDEPPLSLDALDRAAGVLTGAACAVAETGTVVLDAGAGQGRRALTLVPDLHICVVLAKDVVGSVPEAVARIAGTIRSTQRPVTLVSGPSATSDIELDRVEGVHGPRRLEIVLAG